MAKRAHIEAILAVVTGEAFRPIRVLGRFVLGCFRAGLVGPTVSPNRRTLGEFNYHVVADRGYPQSTTHTSMTFLDCLIQQFEAA